MGFQYEVNETPNGAVKTYGDLKSASPTPFTPGDGTSNQIFSVARTDPGDGTPAVNTHVIDVIQMQVYPLDHFPDNQPVFVPHEVKVVVDK